MRNYLKALWKHFSWEVYLFRTSKFRSWCDLKMTFHLIRITWAEETWRYLVLIIPEKLRYFVIIDSWAKSTTGKYGNVDVTKLTVPEMLGNLETRTKVAA